MRALRAAALALRADGAAAPSAGGWTPIGPAPLASDATGNGTQDYHQVAGRATAVAINPADYRQYRLHRRRAKRSLEVHQRRQ